MDGPTLAVVRAGECGSAQLRVPPAVMRVLGLAAGSAVRVRVAEDIHALCTVWPLRYAAYGTTCDMDASVAVGTAPNRDAPRCPVRIAHADIEPLGFVPRAASLRVQVTRRSLDPSPALAGRAVAALLAGHVVSVGAVVHPAPSSSQPYSSVRVTAVDASAPPLSGCVLVTHATVVEIEAPSKPSLGATSRPPRESKGGAGSHGGAASERVAGVGHALQQLLEIVRLPFLRPEAFARMGVDCPRGILLSGPPGVGKTLIARAAADECGAELVVVNGPEVYGAYAGDSEANLRRVFGNATARAAAGDRPVVLFLDEIDALCPRRDAGDQHVARVVAQLLTLMDGMDAKGRTGRRGVVVVGATNRPNAIDPALRRPGRFDREVHIRPPNARDRRDIFAIYTRGLPLSADVDLDELARLANGCVGADIAEVCRAAALAALKRASVVALPVAAASVDPLLGATAHIASHGAETVSSAQHENKGALEQRARATVTLADFERALTHHVPSVLRGAEVRLDPVAWDEIGGCEAAKGALRRAIEWPLLRPEAFDRLGIAPPRGVLLYGPPGCSKTTLVRALAGTAGCALLFLSGAQLYSPYVGDSEREVREVFARARAAAPCIVFLDEIDAIVGDRAASGGDSASSDGVSARVLSALLNEMDGVESARGVLVVGATNRPRALDAALLRPGRFDSCVLVPAPDSAAREQIFRIKTRSMSLDGDVDLAALVARTDGYTGADIESVCREAAMQALRASMSATRVGMGEFAAALAIVPPSLTKQQLDAYSRNPFGR